MKPEELVSKELSMWKERPTKPVSTGGMRTCVGSETVPASIYVVSVQQVMEARAKLHSEGKKAPARPEPAPDMEDSPPVSDSDVSWMGLGLSQTLECGERSRMLTPLPLAGTGVSTCTPREQHCTPS